MGDGDVLEVERHHAEHAAEDGQRTHHTHQRDAGGLHGCQFHALAEVTEGDERCQQHRQRQCLGHQRQGGVIEELGQHGKAQSLGHDVVDIQPQELHDKDEKADEESTDKEDAERLQDEYVKPFQVHVVQISLQSCSTEAFQNCFRSSGPSLVSSRMTSE